MSSARLETLVHQRNKCLQEGNGMTNKWQYDDKKTNKEGTGIIPEKEDKYKNGCLERKKY